MIYLSRILGRPIYYKEKKYGKVLDLAVKNHRPIPSVSKFLVHINGQKKIIDSSILLFEQNHFILRSPKPKILLQTKDDLFLSEDLLDKQVIDVNDKKLVRVNDVILQNNKEVLEMTGIDIGNAGIFRRLGIERIFKGHTIMIPWKLIEAFDYQTGDIRVSVSESKLSTLHPADIADILEEVGSKERAGLVEALGYQKAAKAIQEADEPTQVAILEEIPRSQLKGILEQIPISELADILSEVNPQKTKLIFSLLSQSKAAELRKLARFSDNVAGGLMDEPSDLFDQDDTVATALRRLSKKSELPEVISVVNHGRKFSGTIFTKDLIGKGAAEKLKNLISDTSTVSEKTDFSELLKLFSEYNLRSIAVTGKNKSLLGVVSIDSLIKLIQESEEKEDAL